MSYLSKDIPMPPAIYPPRATRFSMFYYLLLFKWRKCPRCFVDCPNIPVNRFVFFLFFILRANHPQIVQQVCIPQSILGTDVVCQAKSGLGKTAVFVLATLQQIEPVDGEVSVVVLCHTRELAYQIKNEYSRFSKYLPDVRTAVFYGGTPTQKDVDLIKDKSKCPHIIVATPGRLNALVRDKHLRLGNVKTFVIDECDKVLEATGMFDASL